MIEDRSAQMAMAKRSTNRAIELLLGIVTGIVADQELHDKEIQFLRAWLNDHQDAASVWPGSVIASTIHDTLADGMVTDAERDHLLKILTEMAVTDFATTGSTGAEVLQLPINDAVQVDVRDVHVCHTGEFLYGTRSKCEQLTTLAGGIPVDSVSRKVVYLIIGTNVSKDWAHTSYGRKIEQAMELQATGRPINIVSERRWLEALKSGA